MDYNWDDFVAAAQEAAANPPPQDEGPDPYTNPGAVLADMTQSAAQAVSPYAPSINPVATEIQMDDGSSPMPSYFNANPYATPDLRNDRAGNLMESALGQVGSYMGGDYYRSGGTEFGGGMAQLDPAKTINYGMTGVDTSGDNPMLRVYNFGDRDGSAPAQLVAKPIRDFNDYSSIPSPFSPMRDPQTGDRLLDDQGRQRHNDLPGFDYRRVVGAGLNPTTLENGQQVYYDRNNNLTYSARDGQPGALLAGGLGLDGATRQQANYYGWVPTTDRNGRSVYYDEAGNRTFMRNPDGSAGRQILDVNRDARFLDGTRAAPAPVRPMGGVRPPVPPVPPSSPPETPVRTLNGGATGQTIQLNGGQIAVPAGATATDYGDRVEVVRPDGINVTYDKNGKVLQATPIYTQPSEQEILDQNRGYNSSPSRPGATPDTNGTYSMQTGQVPVSTPYTPPQSQPYQAAPLGPISGGYTARPNADGSMIEIVDAEGVVVTRVPAGSSQYAQEQQNRAFNRYGISR